VTAKSASTKALADRVRITFLVNALPVITHAKERAQDGARGPLWQP
jgi:hypothetical protein